MLQLITAFAYGAASILIGRHVANWEGGDREAVLDLWKRGIRKISLLVLPIAALLVGAAPDLIPLAFGAQYDGAVQPFQVFCLILLLRVTNFGAVIQAFGETRSFLRVTLLNVGLNVLLSVPLTLAFGIVGTALGTMTAALLSAGLLLRLIATRLEVPLPQAWPVAEYARTLALSILGVGVAVFARRAALPADAWLAGTAFIAFVGVAIYVAVSGLTGAIRRRDWWSLGLLLRPNR